MLNNTGENGLLCINTDFKGDSFSLALLCMMLTVSFFFKYRSFITLRKCRSFPSFPIIYIIKCVVFFLHWSRLKSYFWFMLCICCPHPVPQFYLPIPTFIPLHFAPELQWSFLLKLPPFTSFFIFQFILYTATRTILKCHFHPVSWILSLFPSIFLQLLVFWGSAFPMSSDTYSNSHYIIILVLLSTLCVLPLQ